MKASLDVFLERNRIDRADWTKSAIDWELLQAIAADHESQLDRLRDSAELSARAIQRFPAVHSVRWRVKDTEHLLEKIVRKRSEGQEKYLNIDVGNYFEAVTDLVGLRALHLFKDDCFTIYEDLKKNWTASEATAYIREGDPQDLTTRFRDQGLAVKEHPAGYRSVHYVCSTQLLPRKVIAEIQVRTIFEEGWSEIDHRVRYPNFSDNQHVAYFLTIFNRLAGSADEMGTFVQGLTDALEEFDSKLTTANQQKVAALTAMENILGNLEAMKKQDADANKKIATLQQEVEKLKNITSSNDIFSDSPPNTLAPSVGVDLKGIIALLSRNPAVAKSLKLGSTPSAFDAVNKVREDSAQATHVRNNKDKK
jgi:ppGpp synthetase/RelA/SpoT-type nucleotidyltranferase